MNLLYSINTLSPHRLSALAAIFLHVKITTLYFNFEREGLCLQFLRMRASNCFGPSYRDDAVTWKKFPREMGFFISKSQISVLKKIPPKWDGNVLTCNQKSIFFNEKDYLNLFLSKYSIPAKRNKLPHITNL